MSKKKVLIVIQEMEFYINFLQIFEIVCKMVLYVQENNMEIWVFMFWFGIINECCYCFYEVVCLLGMNIIVDDDDYFLIIKVVFLLEVCMQVYFLDNEDFFKCKYIFCDEDEQLFEDNVDCMVFFCKGVLEIVKKFGWVLDIVYCYGWMISLILLYFKIIYKNEFFFENVKVVYFFYELDNFVQYFNDSFVVKVFINNLQEVDLYFY